MAVLSEHFNDTYCRVPALCYLSQEKQSMLEDNHILWSSCLVGGVGRPGQIEMGEGGGIPLDTLFNHARRRPGTESLVNDGFRHRVTDAPSVGPISAWSRREIKQDTSWPLVQTILVRSDQLTARSLKSAMKDRGDMYPVKVNKI